MKQTTGVTPAMAVLGLKIGVVVVAVTAAVVLAEAELGVAALLAVVRLASELPLNRRRGAF